MGTVLLIAGIALVLLLATLAALSSRRRGAITPRPIDGRPGAPGAAVDGSAGKGDAARDRLLDQRGER